MLYIWTGMNEALPLFLTCCDIKDSVSVHVPKPPHLHHRNTPDTGHSWPQNHFSSQPESITMGRALWWSFGAQDSKRRASLQPAKVGCSYEEVEGFWSRGKHAVLPPRIQSSHTAETVCGMRAQTKQQGWIGGRAKRLRRLTAKMEGTGVALWGKNGRCRKTKI